MTVNELIGYVVALIGGWIVGHLLAKWNMRRKSRTVAANYFAEVFAKEKARKQRELKAAIAIAQTSQEEVDDA